MKTARKFVIPGLTLMALTASGYAQLARAQEVEPAPAAVLPALGTEFKDCADCPVMVVVPPGRYAMGGALEQEEDATPGPGGLPSRSVPRHDVTIARSFAVAKFEVTFAEWDACVADGGCDGYRPDDEGWGRGNMPVMNVTWANAQAYVQSLSRKTGKPYRLLSESEWEYAARAGTSVPYWWGQFSSMGNANCEGCGSRWDNQQASPVGSFPANGFGLHDMLGNVWEWTQDCENEAATGAPSDGSAWTSGNCAMRVLRGGSWNNNPRTLGMTSRVRESTGDRRHSTGFRVARAN